MLGANFHIEELFYIPMGEHNPMFNRPFSLNVTESAISTLNDRMSEQKSAVVTPQMLGDLSSQFLQPNAVGHNTAITTNWVSQKRYIFMLKVRSVEPGGGEIISYIQGYTEYDGITNQGTVDTTLNHVINNVVETSNYVVRTPLGVQQHEKLYRIYNVMGSDGMSEYFTQRPTDILQTLEAKERYNSYHMPEMDDFMLASSTISPYNNKTIGSLTDNGVGTEYLSKTLTTGIMAHQSRDVTVGSFEVNDQSSTGMVIPEPSISDNRFIKAMSAKVGNMATSNQFRFSVLQGFDPTIYDRFKVLNITKDYVDPNSSLTPTVGEYWQGTDAVTLKAYTLIESAVAIATKYGFSKLHFTASNMMSPTAMTDIMITNFSSFMKLDDSGFNSLLEIFKQKFNTDVFLPETSAGRIPMHMECYVEVLGTTKINLTYAGFDPTWYTIPTTANSAYLSVLTPDGNSLDVMADQVNMLTQSLVGSSDYNPLNTFDPYTY